MECFTVSTFGLLEIWPIFLKIKQTQCPLFNCRHLFGECAYVVNNKLVYCFWITHFVKYLV